MRLDEIASREGHRFAPRARLALEGFGARYGTYAESEQPALARLPLGWDASVSLFAGYANDDSPTGRWARPADAALGWELSLEDAAGRDLLQLYESASEPGQLWVFAFQHDHGIVHPLRAFLLQRCDFDLLRGLLALGEVAEPPTATARLRHSVNIRASPTTKERNVVGFTYGGETALVLGAARAYEGYHWLPVDVGGRRGWIAAEAAGIPVEKGG